MKAMDAMTVIRTVDELDESLRQLGGVEARIDAKNRRLQEEIDRLKDQAEEQVRPFEHERQRLVREIEAYCTGNRKALLGDKRSRKLNFGKVAFRAVAKVDVPDPETTLQLLEERDLGDCINVKRTPDKKKLADLPVATLQDVGVKVVRGESFKATPDKTKVLVAEDE